jgi:hypothetical protein
VRAPLVPVLAGRCCGCATLLHREPPEGKAKRGSVQRHCPAFICLAQPLLHGGCVVGVATHPRLGGIRAGGAFLLLVFVWLPAWFGRLRPSGSLVRLLHGLMRNTETLPDSFKRQAFDISQMQNECAALIAILHGPGMPDSRWWRGSDYTHSYTATRHISGA